MKKIPDTSANSFAKSPDKGQDLHTDHQLPMASAQSHNMESLRVKVESWDDEFIYANKIPSGKSVLVISYLTPFFTAPCSESSWKDSFCGTSSPKGNSNGDFSSNTTPCNFTYLQSCLCSGAQLNLVNPQKKDNVWYAEIIVLEPDYLVNITSIASCFESFAHSPYIYLLNKIKPNVNSEPILLGNFAGQLLDQEVHHLQLSYKQRVKDFYKENVLDLLTAGVSHSFHDSSQAQLKNIHKAICEDLPKLDKDFDADEVVLEPSFFSELLGLQGRMDFLQWNKWVLIEQKSGKSGFPQPDKDTPVYQTPHYVQMLLYMALLRYNFSSQFRSNNHHLSAFLLYSKYKNSLLELDFSFDLFFEAMRIRNQIASLERDLANGGFTVLKTLTSDSLNEKRAHGRLWDSYQQRQIDELLYPIHSASALELAYYFRFLTFIQKEQCLAKVGNEATGTYGFAAKWKDTLENKKLTGIIYDHLILTSPSAQHIGKVDTVTLRYDNRQDYVMANFRVGDIVILYPYNKRSKPDATKTIVFRCSIEELWAESILLSLRATQTDARVFLRNSTSWWAIEPDSVDASFGTLCRGMHAFLSAPKARRDLLLFQRKPAIDETARLTGDYGPFNDLMLHVKQAKDFFLIIGPPGTGKTSFGLVNTLKEALTTDGSSVLLLSYTNRAVDEICSKLVESDIDFIRIGRPLSCAKPYRQYLLSSKVESCDKMDQAGEVIANNRVFVGTTAALNGSLSLFNLKHFDLAIIDEASQILEPHLLGLLSARTWDRLSIEKMVLIGDHKQLPAVVQQSVEESKVVDEDLKAILLDDCRLSLFERLLKKYRDDPQVTGILTKQGRMHKDIAGFSNESFYNHILNVVPLPHQNKSLPEYIPCGDVLEDLMHTHRVAFLAVKGIADDSAMIDNVNRGEACLIAELVKRVYQQHLQRNESFDPAFTVGVIVPYRSQTAAVRKAIEGFEIPILNEITVDTVERYQGSQRDVIIYGFTIQKPYQLEFLTSNVFYENGVAIDRKLNVVMTRAREQLLLVGNPELLGQNAVFRKLMEYIRGVEGYMNITDY